MIEVTQKNSKGIVQILGQYTDKEFGEQYNPEYVEYNFSTKPIMVGSEMVYPAWDAYEAHLGKRVSLFKLVAYNHKGKILDPSHLVGISRKYNRSYGYRYYYFHGFKRGNGGGWRKMKTFHERKWNHAWDDEEFCPKVRSRRDGWMVPDPWDDERYVHTEKNWKKFRKHQWRD